MLALIVLACIPAVMWLGQSLLLIATGEPVRLRLGAHGSSRFVRAGCRAITQFAFVGAILVYPYLLGRRAIDYYGAFLPRDSAIWAAPWGFITAVLFLALLYLAWALADSVRFSIRQKPGRVARRLILLPFSSTLGAVAEELVFRAILLAGLLETMPVAAAVTIGTLIFAGAHYVREVKRRWTFPGHLALGLLLCVAFVRTNALWLPIGLHAGGIFAIMAARPFVRYEGPAWMTGASIFPFAGVVGVAALAILTSLVWFAPV